MGRIARNASRAADEVQANLAQVQDLWSKQKVSAEEAEQELHSLALQHFALFA